MLLKAAIGAVSANGNKVRKPTFDPQKCNAMHESPVRRAAPQHADHLANVRKRCRFLGRVLSQILADGGFMDRARPVIQREPQIA